jgi:hypothetical protein
MALRPKIARKMVFAKCILRVQMIMLVMMLKLRLVDAGGE